MSTHVCILFDIYEKNRIIYIFFLFVLTASSQYRNAELVFENAERVLNSSEINVVEKSRHYCIFQTNQGLGYAIISLRPDSYGKVLGYSIDGLWKPAHMPPIVTQWLTNMRDSNEVHKVVSVRKTFNVKRPKCNITPLITCHWHQESPYNDLSPVISEGNIKTVAGCVAIAAAQIVYYWRNYCPDSLLMDTPVYPYGGAPITESIPKGTKNNWSLMQDEYDINRGTDESRHAVAQLSYALGTGAYLNYASSTSGSIYDVSNVMYAQYLLTSDYSSKSSFSQDEWENVIYDNLSNGQPVLYAGSYSSSGHAFIIHGYDATNNLFYVNFGWGGTGDGYYSMDDETGLAGYCANQSCVYNIKPKYNPSQITNNERENDSHTMLSYNLMGQRVNCNMHGIIIKNGKKFFIR